MRRLIWTMIAAAGMALAQEQPKMVQKLIEIKYADPDRVARLVVGGPGISNVHPDSCLHAISVSGSPEAVAAATEMIKKLDVAPANIELTVYLISGNSRDATDDLPKDLASTAKQLHGVFAYKSYRVLQSFVLRSRDGHDAHDTGALASADATYEFWYRSASVSGGTPRVVHIDGLGLRVSVPTGGRDKDGHAVLDTSTITTDLDAGEGQKVVVGKSSIHGFSEDALILVVTTQVVQ